MIVLKNKRNTMQKTLRTKQR